MERSKEESKLPAPYALWPVELKLTHIDCSPEDKLVHFQGQYMTICELDYNILQVEIQNAPKTPLCVQVGELCLVQDALVGRWYRGRVQNKQGDMFLVFLLDHGNVLTVGPSHLSSISDSLLMLPPKIVCGFFANLLPAHERWGGVTENYFFSLKGSQIKGYIHALLPYKVLILEVPEINRDLLNMGQGRHVDTSTFLLLVEMLTEVPVKQSNESVPDLLIEKQIGQEYCLKSSSLLGFEEILSLNGPKLKVGQKVNVTVTAAVNPGLFYCRLTSTGKDLHEMSCKLALACESSSDYLSDKRLENLGLLCTVKGKDEKWHRGFVQCLPVNSQVRVVFVDSGYCESVKVESVLQLPSEFLSTPIMAFPCSLSCLDTQDDTIKNQQLEALKSGMLGETLELVIDDFCKDRNFYLVTLSTAETHSEEKMVQIENIVKPLGSEVFESKSNFCNIILSRLYTPEMIKALTSDSVPLESIQEGSTFEGYVVHVQNPNHFWIRTKERNANFENMMNEMTDFFSRLQLNEEVFEDPVPGALCCAMFEKDMHYYRALVVDTLEKGAEVFFIDFGNTEKVPSLLIKKLPRKFAIEPEFALNCALAHVTSFQDIWTSTTSDFFRQITSNKTLLVHVIHKKNGKYIVDLFEKEAEKCTNIATILTTANMAEYWRYNPALVSVEFESRCKEKGKTPNKGKLRLSTNAVSAYKDTSTKLKNTEMKPKYLQKNDNESRTPSETTNPEAVATDTFKPVYFKPGTEVSVICSHIISPSDFWCQSKSTKAYLDKLMEAMQMFYKTNTVMFKPPAVCCAVKFPRDNRWYRACKLGEENEKLYVILVDYGIIIKEELQNIRALAPQFVKLKEQAFRCCLNLTESAGGKSWSAEACKLFRDFVSEGSPSLTCKIHSQIYVHEKGLFNVVSIHTPLQQATTHLVEKNVAVEIQTPQLTSSVYPYSFYYSSFNITCGDEELVHVTHVCSPWEIYFQLDRNSETIDKLMERVAEVSQPLTAPFETYRTNVCLARYFGDGQWYRAVRQPVQSHHHVSVFFVDYGDKQICEKHNVLPIPREAANLLMTPMQGLRCSLANIPQCEHLPEVNTWLETVILNKSFQAKFLRMDNNGHFICDLYDGNVHINDKVKELMATHGDRKDGDVSVSRPRTKSHNEPTDVHPGKIKQGSKQSLKPLKPNKMNHKEPTKTSVQVEKRKSSWSPKVVPSHHALPKVSDLPNIKLNPGSKGVGFISHCNSVRNFYIQMENDEPSILRIGEELNSTILKECMKTVASEVKVGDLVAAKYEEDSALYRAVVTSEPACGLLMVEFVDYGNTATVDRGNVYLLTRMLLSQPRLSTPCTLAKPHSFENDESFIKKAVGKPLMVEFIEKFGNSWKVNIQVLDGDRTHEEPRKHNVKDVQIGFKRQDKCSPVTVYQNKNKKQDSHIHRTEKVKSNFQERIMSNTQKTKSEIKNNQTVATKQKKKAATYLQTYGRPKDFWKTSYKKTQFGLKSEALVNSKLSRDSISETKKSKMSKKNVSIFTANALKTSGQSPESVNLIQQDVIEHKPVKNLDDKPLVVDDHPPLPVTSSESSIDHMNQPHTLFHAPIQMNFEYKGFAAAVTTPAEFYIILEELLLITDTVSNILENMSDVLVPLPEVHLTPGAGCLVKSEEKKKWCRAEIVQYDSTSVLINLIDYGHYAVLSGQDICQLKKLPEELARLPKVTYHCLLRGVKPHGPDWSDEAIIFFQKCMCQRNLQIRFRQYVSETQWEVDIITGSQNLAKELVDAGHATYIDNMLGIRFQQELAFNRESQPEGNPSVVKDLLEVFSSKTEHIPKAECLIENLQQAFSEVNVSNNCMSDQRTSKDSDWEEDTTNPLNSYGSDLGSVEKEKLGSSSNLKPCMLM